jgi:Xaa-Pro aminopeptidase
MNRSHSYFQSRISKLQKCLKDWKVKGCVVEDPIDLFYLTGIVLSNAKLIVTNTQSHLFVDGRFIQVCRENSPVAVSLYEDKAAQQFLSDVSSLAFDSQKTSYDQFIRWKRLFPHRLEPVPGLLKSLRLIKDKQELDAMQKSAQLNWKGFLHLKKSLKVGITEQELALKFELFVKQHGAEKLAFNPIIAFGPNGAMPHYEPGKTKLKKGDLVLIDIGVVVDHYFSDMTRVLFFGPPDINLKKLEASVRKAHAAALKKCKPNVSIGQLDQAARDSMDKDGTTQYFLHTLGHGVGLEIHEFPRLKYNNAEKDLKLKPGMVITIEPGLYLPGVGGIRYEDTIVITKTGYRNFYKS